MPPAETPVHGQLGRDDRRGERQLDEQKRKELWFEIQKIQYDEGGLIVPFFDNPLDALCSKVQGLESHWRRELGFFQFQNVWLDLVTRGGEHARERS